MRMLQPVSGDSSKQSIVNYSSRPVLSQLKGISHTILNSYENHQPQTTQISSITNAPFIQNSHRIAFRLTATASFPSVSWKAGPVTCVWLANQIRRFRILARSDAWEKDKCFFYHFFLQWTLRTLALSSVQHLNQRINEHRYSAIGKHLETQQGNNKIGTGHLFKVPRKCNSKFDC